MTYEKSGTLVSEAKLAGTSDSSNRKARLSQLAAEVLVLPTTAEARISQLPVEVLVLPTPAEARISQLPVEALRRWHKESVSVIIID